jgi:hypothetical protein
MGIRDLIQRGFNQLGFELRRLPREVPEPTREVPPGSVVAMNPAGRMSFLVSGRLIGFQQEELALLVKNALSDLLPDRAVDEMQIVKDFTRIYENRPLVVNHHGGGFNNQFWLYVACRAIAPELVVESGVWRGQSTWVLRQAAPRAELHCFDLSFAERLYRDPTAHYHEHDWEGFDFDDVDPERSLVFFDDHQNQAKRICEAHDRGFRHIVFDDNLPASQMHKEDGISLFPTVDMLFDERLAPGEELCWWAGGKEFRAIHDPGELRQAKGLVASWGNFPSAHLDRKNYKGRCGGPSKFAYVRLVTQA